MMDEKGGWRLAMHHELRSECGDRDWGVQKAEEMLLEEFDVKRGCLRFVGHGSGRRGTGTGLLHDAVHADIADSILGWRIEILV